MFLIFALLIASAAAAPATYDQRQDGDDNFRADIENVVIFVAIPNNLQVPLDILDQFRTDKQNNQPEVDRADRADVQVMEAFVEPSTPYKVEIGTSDRSVEGDGRTTEVVIPSRRSTEPEAQADSDEIKLLGATEQCGPEGKRDPVTLVCRYRSQPASSSEDDSIKDSDKIELQPSPEVIPS